MPADLGELSQLALTALASLRAIGVMVLDADLRVVMHGGDPLPEGLTAGLTPHLEAALGGEQREILHSEAGRTLEVQVGPIAGGVAAAGVIVVARDVTDRKAAQHAKGVADQQFRTAFDNAPIGMTLVAVDGSLLRVNPALCNMLGYSEEELLSKGFQELTHPDDLDADVELVHRVLRGEIDEYQLEKRYLRADGESVWALLSVSLVRDEAGAPLHFISQIQDVSRRKDLEERLRRLATFDDLTGLYNRREFQRALAEQQRRVSRYADTAAVLLVDLDDFKSVNDTHGHHVGDALLRHIAETLRARLRTSDITARLGGDEFAVLLPHASEEAATSVAEALAEAVASQPLRFDGLEITARASIGVATLGPDDAPGDALRAADRAMYAIKRRHHAGED